MLRLASFWASYSQPFWVLSIPFLEGIFSLQDFLLNS